MVTEHSIHLEFCIDPCCHADPVEDCKGLRAKEEHCDYRCKFYKPIGCSDWIRIEDEDGISLVPPEEYETERKAKKKREVEYFRIG